MSLLAANTASPPAPGPFPEGQPPWRPSQLPSIVPYALTQLLSLSGSSFQLSGQRVPVPLFGMPFFSCHSLPVTLPPPPLLQGFHSPLLFCLILSPGSQRMCAHTCSCHSVCLGPSYTPGKSSPRPPSGLRRAWQVLHAPS